jgi:hypothetical protein
MEMHGMPDTR